MDDQKRTLLERAKIELKQWKEGIVDHLTLLALEEWNKLPEEQKKKTPKPELKYKQEPNPPQWFREKVAPYLHVMIQNQLYEILSQFKRGPQPFTDPLERFKEEVIDKEGNRRKFPKSYAPFGRGAKFPEIFDKQGQKITKQTYIDMIFAWMDILRANLGEELPENSSSRKVDKWIINPPNRNKKRFTEEQDMSTIDPVLIFTEDPSLFHAAWVVIIKDALRLNRGYLYPRGLFYFLKGRNEPIPILTYNNKSIWQTTWGTDEQTTFILPFNETEYKNIEAMYSKVSNILKELRYYGFIADEAIGDHRTAENIQFTTAGIFKTAELPKVKVEIEITKPPMAEYKAPPIIFTTEKGHIQPLLEQLANDYVCGYFISTGQFSVRAAYDFYKFVKEHGNQAIVFTLNDFDTGGISITKSFARKLQRHALADKNPAQIVVIPLVFHIDDLELLKQYNIEPIIKEDKRSGTNVSQYLVDQVYELAAKMNIIPEDYIIEKVKKYIHPNLLIERKVFTKLDEQRYDELTKELHQKLGFDPHQYLADLKKKVLNDQGVKEISKTLEEIRSKYIDRKVFDIRYDSEFTQLKEEIDRIKEQIEQMQKQNIEPPEDLTKTLEVLKEKQKSIFTATEQQIEELKKRYIDENAPVVLESAADFWVNQEMIRSQEELLKRWRKELHL